MNTAVTTSAIQTIPNMIEGGHVAASSGRSQNVVNPALGVVSGRGGLSTDLDVDDAVAWASQCCGDIESRRRHAGRNSNTVPPTWAYRGVSVLLAQPYRHGAARERGSHADRVHVEAAFRHISRRRLCDLAGQDPRRPAPQEAIPGIDKAARNERGRVDYSAKIILMMPAVPRAGNGALLVDVPNRGLANAEVLYNSPRDMPFLSGTLEQGTGFLQDHGFTVAEVYWELGQGADPAFVRRR